MEYHQGRTVAKVTYSCKNKSRFQGKVLLTYQASKEQVKSM